MQCFSGGHDAFLLIKTTHNFNQCHSLGGL